MHLRELTVHRMPGITQTFTVRATPGLNLIVGPNASGKTSLCRAVRALLWPEGTRLADFSVTATWEIDGRSYHASREGNEPVHWSAEGRVVAPPIQAPAQLAAAYDLGVLALLKADTDETDAGLAAAIASELAGGFNIALVARDLFQLRSRHGGRELALLRETRRQAAQIKATQSDLAAAETDLFELREERAACRQAAARLPYWRLCHALVTTEEELARARTRLAGFPAVLQAAIGDEREQLVRIAQERHEDEQGLALCRQRNAAAEQRQQATELAEGPPDQQEINGWRRSIVACQNWQAESTLARRNLAGLEAALAAAAACLKPAWNPEQTGPIALETVQACASFLRRRERLDARRESLRGTEAALAVTARGDATGLQNAPADPTQLSSAMALLQDWLTTAAAPSRRWWWSSLATLLTLTATGLAAWRLGGWQAGIYVAALGIAGLLAVTISRWLGSTRPDSRDRKPADLVAAYQRTGQEEPAAWTVAAVRLTLRQLAELASVARWRDYVLGRRAELAVQATTLEEESAGLETERRDLIARLGVDPGGEDTQALDLAQRVYDYHVALRDRDEGAARAVELATRLAGAIAELEGYLEGFAYPVTGNLRGVETQLDQLEQRRRDHAAAVEEIARQEEILARLAAAAQRRDEVESAIFARLGLVPGDQAALDLLLDQHDDYRAARQEVASLERSLEMRRGDLERHRQTEGELSLPDKSSQQKLSSQELARRLEADEKLAKRADELTERIAQTETRSTEARRGHSMEDALAALDSARAALTARRDEAQGAALGQLLLDEVVQQHESSSTPPLLRRARELLHLFTHGRYELLVATESSRGRFLVREQESGKQLALDQLSDGSRAQLLLAARLAFVLESEQGQPLPLWLDESLAASDPQRFDAVARSLVALAARDERQIFYLSCNPTDAVAWQRAAEVVSRDGDEAALTVTDLGQLRALAAAQDAETLAILDPAPLPAPPATNGHTQASYLRAIDAPRPDGFARVSALHLGYLLPDHLPRLRELLITQASTVGQWRALAEPLVAAATITTEDRRQIEARIDLAAAWLAGWRVGRGQPVDTAVLVASGAVSDTFATPIAQLLVDLDGDGARLIDALASGALKGFRRNKMEDLNAYLESEGYVDRRPRLNSEQLRARVLSAIKHHLESAAITIETADLLMSVLANAVGGVD